MRKKIIFISSLFFLVPLIIVLICGRTTTVEYDITDINNISISYNKNIIICKKHEENNKLKINISGLKTGKTTLVIKGDKIKDNSIPEKFQYKKKIYVHFTNIITLERFFGKCRGDISFIISYLLALFTILSSAVVEFVHSIKKNLYDYKNIRLLGLILFVLSIFLVNLYIYILNLLNNYSDSIYIFISNVSYSSFIFMLLMIPVVIITSLILFISNIVLVLREGKSWRNMLGVILGGLFFLTTCIAILVNTLSFSNTNTFSVSYIFHITISYIFAIVVAYLECILFGTIILGIVAAKRLPKFDTDYLIILGCKINDDGTLFPLLKSRVDKAIEYAKLQNKKTGHDIIFVPSGGKGDDEIISEAQAMRNYMIEQGIDKKKILIEDKSSNTYENIKFSYNIVSKKSKNPNIAFCTTNYHVFRAGNIASKQNIYMKGIGARTKSYYWINAFIREFVATLVLEKKKHINTIILLIIASFILVIICYLSLFL